MGNQLTARQYLTGAAVRLSLAKKSLMPAIVFLTCYSDALSVR